MFRDMSACVVAYSGGVDSAVVAKAAHLALGPRALAVTGASASLAAGELELAQQVARDMGIRHEVVATAEFDNPAYLQNATDRCFHCKTELYDHLGPVAERFARECLAHENQATIVNGANADDRGDHRPGMIAASQHRVRSPLLECGVTKEEVRQLAAAWELPVWDKPASPCLSSRVAYGEAVTPERLAMIDAAERFLRARGFSPVRVRYHRGDVARIELPADALAGAMRPESRQELVAELKRLGFKFVTLDLEGFRSGSLNELVPLAELWRWKAPESASTGAASTPAGAPGRDDRPQPNAATEPRR